MSTAVLTDLIPVDRHPAALPTGVVLSFLLHIGIAVLLLLPSWTKHEAPPPEFVMEVVQLPKPKPPEPQPAPQVQPALPPPPPPQLSEAPIAEKSVAPPKPGDSRATPREKAPAPDHTKTAALPATPLPANSKDHEAAPVHHGPHDATPDNVSGRATQVASQTVQDFILMQVARAWIIDLRSPRFRGLEITWNFILRPDGLLEPPFGKYDAWDLTKMVNPQTYATMEQPTEQGRLFRTAVTTFLQAIRQAQPFRVPPNEQSYQNRVLPLRFRAEDLPQAGPTQAGR